MSERELSYSGWLRGLLIHNPKLTLEEWQKAHAAAKWDKPFPQDKQYLYLAANQIKKRFGISSLDVIPLKPNGELNLTGLIRMYWDKYGVTTPKDVIEFMATDGISVTNDLCNYAKKGYVPAAPDANQNSGPRAGSPSKKRRSRRSTPASGRGKGRANEIYVEAIYATRDFIHKVGSINNARAILDILETIQTK